jgi:hypothetical protein
MSSTDRQNNLLVSEDWQKIYQSFKNADFQSYDFDNLRRTMIDYIRTNFPEDFNDYIESSEYLALIDLIAFVGQSIAFRVDLNARNNFLELAERTDAVLRLARMISYNPTRNIAAQGLLKFTTVVTTENVIDSNGLNLSGQTISWNDPSNTNWYDQFIKVLNAAFPSSQQFGNPADKATIYSIPTEQYRFNSNINGVPVFSFTKTVSGNNTNFEITSTTFKGQNYIYEEPPAIGNSLACIYSNDSMGPGSPGTGFFLNFVQGALNQGTFTVTQPSSNESIDINANNINNNDVWLYQLDANGKESTLWTQVPNLVGNNIIYNSLNQNIQTIYQVVTRTGDMVSLQFSDGTFGQLPLGQFRSYYRISNGLSYIINTQDIRSVNITFPYTSAAGQPETISITLNLQTSVANANTTESISSIKTNAPQTYYTQNRMITGEDYNISPLSATTQVVKVKSLNRTSSGISRYFDLKDPTGAYSSTILYGTDGVLYNEEITPRMMFTYQTTTDIEGIIYNDIFTILNKSNLRNFYYANYLNYLTTSLSIQWNSVTTDSNTSSGYITDISNSSTIYKVGSYTTNDLKYLVTGALVKFTAPIGYYFDTTNLNKLIAGTATLPGSTTELWAEVVTVTNDGTASGTGTLTTGFGPIIFNKVIPTGAVLNQLIPTWITNINTSVVTTMIDLIFANNPFGLSYNAVTQTWQIIFESNLNTVADFSLASQGDLTNKQQDSSWLLLFTTDNVTYTVTSREQQYVFESDKQIQFYFGENNTIYDPTTNSVVKDRINVLSINTQPGSVYPFTNDLNWEITSAYIGLDGYIDNTKLVISFADFDNNGVADNPELFVDIVNPSVRVYATGIISSYNITLESTTGIVLGMAVSGAGIGLNAVVTNIVGVVVTLSQPNTSSIANIILFELNNYIIQQKYTISDGQEDYTYVSNSSNTVIILQNRGLVGSLSQYKDGQYFYFEDTDTVVRLNLSTSVLEPTLDYKVYPGRDNLKFQYIHSADYESRIDPSPSNIVDVYVLTSSYDISFRQYLASPNTVLKPLPPGTDELFDLLDPRLSLIKSISDEVIYHSASYKVLFGSTATPDVQASFKVVKNPEQVNSDNYIQTSIINCINDFFALENWDFGDTFYFSELAAYVMQKLAPNITSFVIVPRQGNVGFGNLYEITSASDQLFISGATVNDIDIVSALTPTILKALTGTTTSDVPSQNVISAPYGATNG